MKIYHILFTLSIFVSCSANNGNSSETNSDIPKKQDSIKDSKLDPEQAKSIIEFLAWYKNNSIRLSQIELTNHPRWANDSIKFISVNFTNTEKYLTELKSSGLISEKYLAKERKFYLKCQEEFITDPQESGPPINFICDHIIWTQVDEGDLDNLDKIKIMSLNSDTISSPTIVQMPSSRKYKYVMSKEDGKWKIDDIQPM